MTEEAAAGSKTDDEDESRIINSMEKSVSSINEDKFDDKDNDLQKWSQQKDSNFMKNNFEKFVYFLSVFNLSLTAYAAGGHGGFLPWLYTIKAPIFIIGRFLVYKNRSWHWFLMDFCYFANATLFIYLWIYPTTEYFSFVYALTNGPLLFALVIFGNSLVFHSFDKITSLLIHMTPAMVTYIIRHESEEKAFDWWDIRGWRHTVCQNTNWLSGCASIKTMILYPFMFTLAHQLFYFLVIHVIFKKKIMSNPKSLTSYRYLFPKGKQRGLFWKIINVCGRHLRVYMYGLVFITYATITFIIAMVSYRYKYVNFILIIICVGVTIKNGADFYGKVYTKRMQNKNKTKIATGSTSSATISSPKSISNKISDESHMGGLTIRLEATPQPPPMDQTQNV